MVQLLQPHETTGKTIALTFWTCGQSDISAFEYAVSFPSKEQTSFNFIAAAMVHSNFGTQENKMSLLPIFPHLFAMKWCD